MNPCKEEILRWENQIGREPELPLRQKAEKEEKMEKTKTGGRRLTPLMGWASWNCFRTHINESVIKEQADMLISSGLAEAGYRYLNIDDGFFGGRSPEGELLFHRERFPNGMRNLADYAHERGLKAGIYTDAGDNTCGYYYDNEKEGGFHAGCYGHEEEDLRKLLVEEDFDFIKVDWCGGLRLDLDEQEQYTKIANIIETIRRETGKPIVYNVCRWEFPGEWVTEIADSWRTGLDIAPDFESILYQIDHMKPLARFCRPGHVNDSDMMQIGNGMSPEEEKTHFAMWCMLSTPLMIGGDLTKLSDETLEILKNRELIGLNQDAACRQAVVAREYRDREGRLLAEMWVKELAPVSQDTQSGGKRRIRKAVAFLNRSDEGMELGAAFREAGLDGEILSVREVCRHENWKISNEIEVSVPSHGVSVFLVESTGACQYHDCNANLKADVGKHIKITDQEMKKLLEQGAVLADVRSPGEYGKGHLDGAVNIPYVDIYLKVSEVLPDKERPVIVYCATGKRSSMAKDRLEFMGYQKVYYLGGRNSI